MWCTSTSYIDFSTESGSMPWLMVRLPWGSMSIASTRCPASANATARLSVVVVLATPPFWLANAITSARGWLPQDDRGGDCAWRAARSAVQCAFGAVLRGWLIGRSGSMPCRHQRAVIGEPESLE